MPRLRSVRTKEDAEKIPSDQPIQVIIEDNPEIELSSEAPDKKEPQDETEKKIEVKQPEPEPEPEDKKLKEEPTERELALTKQLEELRRAEAASKEALAQVNREKEELARQHAASREQTATAQYDTIIAALDAATSDAEKAQADLERAEEIGDIKAKTDAYRRLAKADGMIGRLEESKTAFESRRETAKKTEEVSVSDDQRFEAAIQALPQSAKVWLRSHPEYVTDPNQNRRVRYFHDKVIIEEGRNEWSPEYFESLETHLGLREPPKKVVTRDDDDEDEQIESPPPRSRVVTQAPPSRDSVSISTGKPVTTRITLSPEQREAARIAGTDEVTYAQNLLRLQREKANGHHQGR